MSTGLLFPRDPPPPLAPRPPAPQRVLPELTLAQEQAALCITAPALVIAGPGSGKTRTLIARLAHLVEGGIAHPDELCAITFTRKAASELRERLGHRLGERAAGITVGTFHQLCLHLLPLTAGVRLISDGQRQAILTHILRHQSLTARGQPVSTTTLVRRIRRLSAALSLAKGEGASALQSLCRIGHLPTAGALPPDPDQRPPEPALEADPRDEATWLAPAASAYGDWLAALSLIDLDDLLLRTTAELQARQQAGLPVAPYRFVHIDEYQDVSGVQRELFCALSANGAAVFAIGDPDQSIYAFRGASLDHFYAFPADFPGAQVFYLRENFRSQERLVQAASALIAHSPAPPGSGLPPGPTAQATRKAGAPIEVQAGSSPLAEAIAVARQIERLVGGTSLTSHDQGRAAAWASGQVGFSDIAVLTRTVARADELAAALEREGIPILRPRRARPLGADPASENETPLARALTSCPALPNQLDGEQRAALGQARDLAEEGARDDIGEAHESDEWDARLQRVAVLTLHGSKGLEFPVVFLCGCEADLLPGIDRSATELAEERRLLYVGMTRAQDLLWLSHAGPRPRSPFFAELPEGLLHLQAPTPRKPKPPQLKLF